MSECTCTYEWEDTGAGTGFNVPVLDPQCPVHGRR